jgi:hypothetical protein
MTSTGVQASPLDYIPPNRQNLKNNHIILSLGLAAFTLGQALQNGDGFLTFEAIIWLTASILFSGYALVFYKTPLQGFISGIWFPVLTLGLAWQIYQLATTLPGMYLLPSSMSVLWVFKSGIVIAGGMALLSLAPPKWISHTWQTLLVILTLLLFFLLGIWMIKSSPDPAIDVFLFHQTSAETLIHGQNPYTIRMPNIYNDVNLYGEELINDDGSINYSNPYPPLNIYFTTLGYLIGGDIRHAYLLAIIVSGALIAFLHAGREAKLAAFIFLFTPRIFFVLEQSWTEPLVLLCLTAMIFCAVHYPRWVSLTLGLFFSSKQYLLFIIPLSLLLFPISFDSWQKQGKPYIWMFATMFLTSAPLAFWNLPAFIWNVGGMLWYYIFRPDALSYLALYANIFNQPPPQYIILSFAALAISFFIVWRFASRDLTGFILSAAFCLLIFFAFNKQAFCNYYLLVIGAICGALACATFQKDENEISTLHIQGSTNNID